jgi:hypothetical protein
VQASLGKSDVLVRVKKNSKIQKFPLLKGLHEINTEIKIMGALNALRWNGKYPWKMSSFFL